MPLDSLIVSRYTMSQAVVDHIVAAHPPPITPQRLVEPCPPLTAPAADFLLAGRSAHSFTFVADAHDMRFLDAQLVEPVQVQQALVMCLTLAPCLIQPCDSMADLQQVAFSEILDNADLYFDTPPRRRCAISTTPGWRTVSPRRTCAGS